MSDPVVSLCTVPFALTAFSCGLKAAFQLNAQQQKDEVKRRFNSCVMAGPAARAMGQREQCIMNVRHLYEIELESFERGLVAGRYIHGGASVISRRLKAVGNEIKAYLELV